MTIAVTTKIRKHSYIYHISDILPLLSFPRMELFFEYIIFVLILPKGVSYTIQKILFFYFHIQGYKV
jgi:hypothetical protein